MTADGTDAQLLGGSDRDQLFGDGEGASDTATAACDITTSVP